MNLILKYFFNIIYSIYYNIRKKYHGIIILDLLY